MSENNLATCVGCGCHDLRACATGCWWLRVDCAAGVGVCSQCAGHVAAWDTGARDEPPAGGRAMKDYPILFNGPMVRAVLDGSKTKTRRPVKGFALELLAPDGFTPEYVALPENGNSPYGYPGDRLWVRESWRVGKPHDKTKPVDILPPLLAAGKGVTVLYEAGGWRSVGPEGRDEPIYPDDEPMPDWAGKGRPSIHMPRALSRILLEVVSVRVERLQQITEDDCYAEGIDTEGADYNEGEGYVTAGSPVPAARWAFGALWQSTGGDWEANPWVWAVEFNRLMP